MNGSEMGFSGAHLGRKSVSSANGPKFYHVAFHVHQWKPHVITAPMAFPRDCGGAWTNPDALIDPSFAAGWSS